MHRSRTLVILYLCLGGIWPSGGKAHKLGQRCEDRTGVATGPGSGVCNYCDQQHKGCKLICWTPELAGGRQVCGTGTCVCKNAASTNDNQPRPKSAEKPQQPSEDDAPPPWTRDENGNLEQAQTKPSVTEKLTLSDFVIAFNTYHQNEAVAAAGRYSRQGVRTLVGTSVTLNLKDAQQRQEAFNETWLTFPDDEPARSLNPGDTRAALLPFFAYRHFGHSFKWLVHGDDDTVLFLDAIMQLVKDLDPDMPYIVTDNMWFSGPFGGGWHPHHDAIACLPCGYAGAIKRAVGCPCTPQLLCAHGDYYGRLLNPEFCAVPRTPAYQYAMHGAAGTLISVGLLRTIPLDRIERCVKSTYNIGSDGFLTTCLWEAGVGLTMPDPAWHPDNMVMFDPCPRDRNADEDILDKVSHVLANLLRNAANICTGHCKLEVERIVTSHMRTRRLGGTHGAAAIIGGLTRFRALHGRHGARGARGQPHVHQSVSHRLHDNLSEVEKEVDGLFKAALDELKRDGETYKHEDGRGKADDLAKKTLGDVLAIAERENARPQAMPLIDIP